MSLVITEGSPSCPAAGTGGTVTYVSSALCAVSSAPPPSLLKNYFPRALGNKLLVLVMNNYRPLATNLPVFYNMFWGSPRFYLLK